MANNARTGRKTGTAVVEKGNVTTEVSKISITFVAILGVAVGLWSLACIVGGLVASGGPLEFAASWFKAVSGM